MNIANRQIVKFILTKTSKNIFCQFENVHYKTLHTNRKSAEEIRIPVQWGHVAAKWWGGKHHRPILALHGWQDNAGSWNTLIPLIQTKRPVLAIDLPGHGFSSRNPPGFPYDIWQWVHLITHLKDHFKWDKVSLMAHSVGSVTCFRYATVFPEDVDFYIGIETLDYYDYYETLPDMDLFLDKQRKFHARDDRVSLKQRFYTFDEMSQAWHSQNNNSISLESVAQLLERGAVQSQSESGKYCFTRDDRLKSMAYIPESKDFVEAMSKRLVCPTLFIKGRESHDPTREYMASLRNSIMKNNPAFESYTVPGTHHLHLNNPMQLAPLVNKFLEKHDTAN